MVTLLLIVATCIAQNSGPKPLPAWVSVDQLEVFEEPDEAGFVTDLLAKGDRVLVRRFGPEGWAVIVPPREAFSLIDAEDIEEVDDTHARVVVKFAIVHPGRDGARSPGQSRVSLRSGAVVRLLDRRAMVVRRQGEATTWRAIAPPIEESRFVRETALLDNPPPDPADEIPKKERDELVSSLKQDSKRTKPAAIRIGSIDENFSGVQDSATPANPSPELAAAEQIHRQILRLPMDRWDLSPAKTAYQSLLDRNPPPAERGLLEARLAKVARQDAAAKSARTMASVLKKSRDRDPIIAGYRRRVAESSVAEATEYDGRGMLQSTSQIVDGQKIFALIGEDGKVDTFVVVPPGLSPGPLLYRQVGVRGDSRYNAGLRGRLIVATDLDALGQKP